MTITRYLHFLINFPFSKISMTILYYHAPIEFSSIVVVIEFQAVTVSSTISCWKVTRILVKTSAWCSCSDSSTRFSRTTRRLAGGISLFRYFYVSVLIFVRNCCSDILWWLWAKTRALLAGCLTATPFIRSSRTTGRRRRSKFEDFSKRSILFEWADSEFFLYSENSNFSSLYYLKCSCSDFM